MLQGQAQDQGAETPLDDPEWDAFLANNGGHHVQSSLWACVKHRQGWNALRVIERDRTGITAGAQILYRSVPFLGAVGYVQKGPVSGRAQCRERADTLLAELLACAKARGIRQIYLQPPWQGQWLDPLLQGRGFRISRLPMGLTATAMIDLRLSPEELLANMRPMTRRNVRLGTRRGLTVRHGSEADIPAFCNLLASTATRQEFVPDPEQHFRAVWEAMAVRGQVRLLIVEWDQQPVSAAWLIGFGDTIVYKRGAWSGTHGERRPNELMHWSAMLWARDNGYTYYDFDGVLLPSAEAAHEVDAAPSARTVGSFKLGFGGSVEPLPPTYEISLDARFRVMSAALPKLHKLRLIRNLMKRRAH